MGDLSGVHPTARINVESLEIGEGSHIGAGCVIEGREVVIGNDFWMDEGAVIGGGSCFGARSSLKAGHYLHMGRNSFINTSRAVSIGHEVGLGMGSSIFTHGAYLPETEGFPVAFEPVSIGDRVWLPGATVNPGVEIGSDVVIGIGSVVISDIPSGSLAVGVPAKVVRENAYPSRMSDDAFSIWESDVIDSLPDIARHLQFDRASRTVSCGSTMFFLDHPRHIVGAANARSEALRDELRRRGIRFYVSPDSGRYRAWGG